MFANEVDRKILFFHMSVDAVSDAKRFFLQCATPTVRNVIVTLQCGSRSVAVESASEMASFDASAAVATTLDASVEGQLHGALDNYVSELIRAKLAAQERQEEETTENKAKARDRDKEKDERWALRHGDSHYALTALYHMPELLAEGARVQVVCVPKFFPFDNAVDEFGALRSLLRAEALYYAEAESHAHRKQNLEQALQLCEEAAAKEPNNAAVSTRRAAVLSKLGRKREAIEVLKAQHKAMGAGGTGTGIVGKVYYRMGMLLYDDEKYSSALVTLHGGAKQGLLETRSGSKMLTLGRKCIVQLYGSTPFAQGIPMDANVMHMIFDRVNVWDVLRASQVCLCWSVFGSMERYWRRRVLQTFTSDEIAAAFNPSGKQKTLFRILSRAAAHRIEVVGIRRQNTYGFHLYPARIADYPRFRWPQLEKYLGNLNDYSFQEGFGHLTGFFWNTSGYGHANWSCLWTVGAILSMYQGVPDFLCGVAASGTRSGSMYVANGQSCLCDVCGRMLTKLQFETEACARKHSGELVSAEDFIKTKECRKLELVGKWRERIEDAKKRNEGKPHLYTCCPDRITGYHQVPCTPTPHRLAVPGKEVSYPVRYLVGMAGAVEGKWSFSELPREGWDGKDPATHPMEAFIAKLVSEKKNAVVVPDAVLERSLDFDLFG